MFRILLLTSILSVSVQQALGQGIFHYYTGLILPDKDAPMRMDRLGLDFIYNSWLELPENVKVKPYSIGFNLFRIYDVPFGHSGIGFGIGYGLSSHNVHHNGYFSDSMDITTGGTYTDFVAHDPSYNYRKNKISTNYFEIPFELRFRTKRKLNDNGNVVGPFRFYPGFKVGYLANIHTSIKDDAGKFKAYNFFNVNKFRYGVTLRVGYGRMAFYGFYSLTNLFKDNKGVELQPFSLGISFLTF